MSDAYKIQLIRRGVPVADLTFTEGTVRMDASAAIKRVLECTLIDLPEGTDFLVDRLRVADAVTDQPVGVFIVATAPRSVSGTGSISWHVEAYDYTYLLQRNRIESPADAYWYTGTKYTDCIDQILVRCGIENAVIAASNETLNAPRTDWEPGTSWLDVVNQLLDEIGYSSVWFDSAGVCQIAPYVAPELRDVSFEYRAGPRSTILRSHTVKDDTFDTPNVFTVCVDGPDQTEPIWAQAINDDPSSRLSVPRRGRIMAPVEKLDGISGQEAAQAYANELRRRSMCSTETAMISTAPETGHEVLDILAVILPELEGKWEELAWELPLNGGLMQHEIRRAVYV